MNEGPNYIPDDALYDMEGTAGIEGEDEVEIMRDIEDEKQQVAALQDLLQILETNGEEAAEAIFAQPVA